MSGVAAVLLFLVGCAPDVEPGAEPSSLPPSNSETSATSGIGRERREPAKLSERASDAAEVIASGDGLRVVNRSGGDVWLVFPDEDRVQVKAGRYVVVHRPCGETLPLRAVTSGADVQVHSGPCRERDIWVID